MSKPSEGSRRILRLPSPRTQALILAGLLVALLVGLVFALIQFLEDGRFVAEHSVVAGVQPIVIIEGPGEGPHPEFGRPMGVAVGLNERIYVTDAEHSRVAVFEPDGDFLFEFGRMGVAKPLPTGRKTWQPGDLNFPVGIDTDRDGNVYVADFRNDQIQVFDADGMYLRSFPDAHAPVGRGSSGQDNKGIAVTDVAVWGNKVFATDRYQIFVFSLDGEFITQFGRPGQGLGELDHPNGVAVDSAGTVYVSDSNHSRVAAFSQDGSPLWHVGRIPDGIDDAEPREFGLPKGLMVAEGGTILVADAFDFALVALAPDGSVVHRYGERGVLPGNFMMPNDVEQLGDLFVVADKENRRVQVVRLSGGGISF